MANALTLKSAGAITDLAQPQAKRDRMLNSGTMFLFDLALPYCIDLAVTPVNDASVINLVPGAPNALLKVPAAGDLVAVAGKGLQTKASASFGRVQIDTGTQYFQANLTHDFLLITWVTMPATDPGGAHIGMIFSKGPTSASYAPPGPWLASRFNGNAGLPDQNGKFDASVGNGMTINNANTEPDPPSPAGKHQFAFAKVGANIFMYRDGAQLGAQGAWSVGLPLAANSNTFDWGNKSANNVAPPGMIMHRLLGEDLTVSGKTAAGQVAADYAQNSARFA